MQFFLRTIISALLISGASILSKKLPALGAILISLPLSSLLAIVWLYTDTHDTQKIIDFSASIFWAVLPSLLFFILLPVFLRLGMRFGYAMLASSFGMIISYFVYSWAVGLIGVRL